ncbi:MAG TPA: porphobilinogen synthase [Longimicrobiales bacterium]|nr:porphobilinogen synthase [Longimicrobiales bacterium]
MSFPRHRPRRLRRTAGWRDAVRETSLAPDQFILPLFLVSGEGVADEVSSMPGVYQHSVDEAVKVAKEAHELGVAGVILFGIPDDKDAAGSAAWDPDGPVCRGLRALRAEVPGLLRWADVCMCEYTDHGHCGILTDDGDVDNDRTLPLLARTSVAYADAGADAVCPSDMMDGRVAAIRDALDEADHPETVVVSYAVKYASAFYGPFRDAAHSTPSSGDRRGYQMDPANGREAYLEALADLDEGADLIMVKPAGPYLDIIRSLRDIVDVPLVAYQVSGEYAALKAADARGWLDGDRVIEESLLAIRRAGARLIITYAALDVARRLADR